MKRLIPILLAVGLLAMVGFQRRQASLFRVENQELAIATAEAGELKANLAGMDRLPATEQVTNEIARLLEENRDLPELRNEVRQLREQKVEFEKLRAENERMRGLLQTGGPQTGQVAPEPIRIAKEQFANQGFLTPEATVQTYFWARREGNVLVLSNCLLPEFLPDFQQQSLDPANGRLNNYLAEHFKQTTAIETVARQVVSANAVIVGIREHKGRLFQSLALSLERRGDEWKLVMNLQTLWR